MRRAVIVFLIATICSLHLAAGVAQAGRLRVTPTTQAEGNEIVITGKTGCRKAAGVHIRSLLRDGRRAIKSGKVPVKRNGTFSTTRRVRTTAVGTRAKNFTIVSHCRSARGQRSGSATLRVLPFTGLPVLPQLLVGVALMGSGVAMVRGDRRAGASGRRRRRSTKPLRAIAMGADG
jgi:hypothetical protein